MADRSDTREAQRVIADVLGNARRDAQLLDGRDFDPSPFERADEALAALEAERATLREAAKRLADGVIVFAEEAPAPLVPECPVCYEALAPDGSCGSCGWYRTVSDDPEAAGWRPDWTLPPEPQGDDEDAVKALYYREAGVNAGLSWRELQEWQRESWRREYRAVGGE